MSETAQRMRKVLSDFDARVQAAPADAWANPSPCEDWTARDVVVHVANGYLRIAGGLSGQPLEPVGDDEDPKAAWGRAHDAVVQALETADLSASIPGPMGPMPAEQLLGRIMASDTLVHTWDLARATGGDERLDAEFVRGAFSGLKPMDAMLRRPGVFGPKVDAPADADEQTQFLAFVGRRA